MERISTNSAEGRALESGYSCSPNFRDLGGLIAADGRCVRPGRLFRSGTVQSPDPEKAEQLRSHGIKAVCDLRSGFERSSEPNPFWQQSGAQIRTFEVSTAHLGGVPWDRLQDGGTGPDAIAVKRHVYRSLPRALILPLREIVSAPAQDQSPILIHCTAGKDRTGVLVALLLTALTADEAAFIAAQTLIFERGLLRNI